MVLYQDFKLFFFVVENNFYFLIQKKGINLGIVLDFRLSIVWVKIMVWFIFSYYIYFQRNYYYVIVLYIFLLDLQFL